MNPYQERSPPGECENIAMRPTFAQLEAFYWAGRLGGFHAAARHLHLTQPTISARVAELEYTLGAKLFERARQRVDLSVRGREILGSVERILRISDEISAQQKSSDTLRGLLRLGAVESVAFFMLPILLPRLRASFPDLKIELTLDIGTVLNRKLAARELDMVILTDVQAGEACAVERLGVLDYAWVAGPNIELPDRALVPADLRSVPILVHPERSTIFTVMTDWFQSAGVEPEHVTLCNSLSLTSRLVSAGYGVSVLQPRTLQAEIDAGSIRVLRSEPAVGGRSLLVAYYDRSAPYRVLIEMVGAAVRESGLLAEVSTGAAVLDAS